jgi:uncharacterized membrane protein HdeD (DUF308 family)
MMLVLSGIASIVLGAIVFLYPLGAGALALIWMIAIWAIFSGAMMLALAVRLRAWTRTPPAQEAVSAPFD